MKVPVLLINLDRSFDRLHLMQAQAAKTGLPFERVPAVDGREVPENLARYFAHHQIGAAPMLAPGALGCYASHLKVYERITAARMPLALVLEDDAVFDDRIVEVLGQTLAALPAGWDMVHLSSRPDRAVKPLADLACGRTLVRYSRIPSGAAGYLISAAGARKMLNPAIPRFWAIDCDTRRAWVFGLDAYGLVAPPIHQGAHTPSTIRALGGRHRLRAGLPRPTPFSWTNQPLRSLRSAAFNARKLGTMWWLRCLAINSALKVRAALKPVAKAVGLMPARTMAEAPRQAVTAP